MAEAPKNFRPDPYPYHQELTLKIEGLTNLGFGVGRDNGWVILIPFTLPEETVRLRIYRNHKNYSEADLIEVLEAAPDRVEPLCPLFGDCGGCQYQHLSYEKQLSWKRQHVQDAFARLAGLETEIQPTWPSPQTYGYRAKLTPHFKKSPEGIDPIGFLRYGRRHSIVGVDQCPIATDDINQRLPTAKEELRKKWKGKRGGTLLLRQVVEGIVTDPDEVVTEKVGSQIFQFKAGEFFQNNPFLLPEMVTYVADEASGGGAEYLVDAYCGSGLFAISASHLFKQCTGIEISAQAAQWARANAAINRLENCEFILGSASEVFSEVPFSGDSSALVIDPPRKGCDRAFLEQALAFGPKRIIYVSCDPATQARDVEILLGGGYRVESIQPFDLFPQTRHVETVATLIK
ncbi:MAG: SAM-dependent methyltransferase [Opitutae bacterium]|nr:SAM-dependent methyltransferase [Opitutae bacterium]|tara:strand:- start:1234 stop:2442 length:1209 start_codon:yes stop_codon:yes gene_type:complete